MKGLLTAAASLASLVATAGVALACALVFAGPHSDILPSWLQAVVFTLAWAAVLGVPIAVGRFTWRRLHQTGVVQRDAPADPTRPAGSSGR